MRKSRLSAAEQGRPIAHFAAGTTARGAAGKAPVFGPLKRGGRVYTKIIPDARSDTSRIFNQPPCHHAPEVYGGIRESEAAEMLKAFFRDRR